MPTAILTTALTSREIADLAVTALHDEVDLTPKPGLVDRRGPGAHTDMTRDMLHASADTLLGALTECADAAAEMALGPALRAHIGVIGRAGERTMLSTTGGVNTHRGALWTLGLLSAAAGAGATSDVDETVTYAAALARIPDPAPEGRVDTAASHGAHARRRYRVTGAPGEAQQGFPHLIRYAIRALRAGRSCGDDPTQTQLHALLALMSHLDDTCLLYRGGADGLAAVQTAAEAVMSAGGVRTPEGRQRFSDLDRLCVTRHLSPGGSGDLLAAALLLDTLVGRSETTCKP